MRGSLKILVNRGIITSVDWMNFKISRDNRITFHHIVKEVDGGKRTIDNGAPLTVKAHDLLNIIEFKNIDKYCQINQMLKMINNQRVDPKLWQREYIFFLIVDFFNNEGEKYKHFIDNMLTYEELPLVCIETVVFSGSCFEKNDKSLVKVLH